MSDVDSCGSYHTGKNAIQYGGTRMKSQIQINIKIAAAIVALMTAMTSGCDGSDEPSNPLVTLLVRASQSTVTFNSLDADEQACPETITVTLPSKTVDALPTEPVKSGMLFSGWTTAPNGCGEQFTADTHVKGNITVYATWSTPGLKFTLINDGKEYSVQKGSADTSGTVVIPGYWSGKKVTAVGAYGFSNCITMSSVSIPDHVTTIGENAFYGCRGLTGVTLPGSLAYIGQAAFYSAGLMGIAIPCNVTEIGPGAFAYCSGLASLTFALPSRLTVIGEYAFGFCTNLTHTTLPGSVTSIIHRAFYSCINLTEIILDSVVPPEICICVFFNCPTSLRIKVPASSIEAYKATTGWSNYADMIVSQ